MIKKLLIICIISMSFLFISCANQLTLQERVDCLIHCTDSCTKYIKVESMDITGDQSNKSMIAIDPECAYKCIKDCGYKDYSKDL